MHTSDYRKIEGHPLRNVLRSVIVDSRDLPSRSELRAAIDESCPPGTDQSVKDALFTKAVEWAQTAANDPGTRFDLRGACDRMCLHVIKTWEASESLLPVEDTEPVDVSSVMESIDGFDPTQKRLNAIVDAAKSAELESNLRRHGGGS